MLIQEHGTSAHWHTRPHSPSAVKESKETRGKTGILPDCDVIDEICAIYVGVTEVGGRVVVCALWGVVVSALCVLAFAQANARCSLLLQRGQGFADAPRRPSTAQRDDQPTKSVPQAYHFYTTEACTQALVEA
jgi:hypothetical protein